MGAFFVLWAILQTVLTIIILWLLFGKHEEVVPPSAPRIDHEKIRRERYRCWENARMARLERYERIQRSRRRGYRAPPLDSDEEEELRFIYPPPVDRTCIHDEACIKRGCGQHGPVPEMFRFLYTFPLREPVRYTN